MTDKVLSAYTKSCLPRLLVGLGLSLGMFVVVLGVSLFFGFLTSNDLLSRDLAPLVMMGCFLFLFFVLMVGIMLWGLWVRQKRNQQLDGAFTPWGLQPRNYLISGRQYSGTYRGRAVNLYFHVSGGRYVRTPVLEIFVRGNIRTRLGLGSSNVLTRLGGTLTRQKALSIDDPIYEGVLIYPLDESWARTLLANPFVRTALTHLLGKDTPGVRAVVYTPDAVSLTLRHFGLDLITPSAAREWLEDLTALAEQAEKQLPPTITAESSKIEQNAIANRGAFTIPVVVVMLGILFCVVGMVVLVLTMTALTGTFP